GRLVEVVVAVPRVGLALRHALGHRPAPVVGLEVEALVGRRGHARGLVREEVDDAELVDVLVRLVELDAEWVGLRLREVRADGEPGAVEADALRLYHDPLVGFDALAPPFLADLNGRALQYGGAFLTLGYDDRVKTVMSGLGFDNPSRTLWEAAAAVPFTAFCA